MGDDWGRQLQEYIAVCRQAAPLPNRDSLTTAQEWHCRIVGGSLLNWLRQVGPQFLQERAALSKLLEVDAEPMIVFTSDVPGLVAAQEILGPDHDRILLLLEDEYPSSALLSVDTEFRHHVHVWSFFRPMVEPEFETKAQAKYPLSKGCVHWQHSEGTMWAVNAGRGGDHLWRWDGHEPELLEEAFLHWVS